MRVRTVSIRAIAILLALFFLPFPKVSALDAQPKTSALSAVLYEPVSGCFLLEKDADKRRPMASTTKIMTALLAIENSALDDKVVVDARAVGIEGTSVYLQAGETITMENLLYALLLQSANDAAAAIAIEIGGSIEEFAQMMNERARSMGLTNTHFTNPHGLHDENHYTTARELAIIAAEAMKNDTFCRIVSTKKATIPLHDGKSSRVVSNHNRLLSMYPGTIGVKTGFTKTSGRCLVSAAEREGVRLITVTLNASNDWQDHISLYNYGFSHFVCLKLIDKEEYQTSLPIKNGQKSSLTITNASPLTVTLPRGESAEIVVDLSFPNVNAPISKGAHLGWIHAIYQGKTIASSPLIATESIAIKKKRIFFDWLF